VTFKIRLAVVLACAVALPVSTWAAEAEESTGALEEIVITAQKRTERLEDVPVSAQVISNEAVARLNAGDISDLNRLVPSVQLNGTINGRVPLGVRGIQSVSNQGNVGLASGVAIMIDGVPIPSDARSGNALEDVQAVEVLKGPQATLGGRTAAQGVVNIVTRKPSDTLTGSVSLMATDDDEYRANGFIAGPVGDAVQYSLAAYYTTRDYPIRNLRLGKNTNQDVYGARGKLLFNVTDDLDVQLTARIGRDKSDGFNFVYVHTSPGIHLLTGEHGPPFLAQDVLLPGITASWDNQAYSSPINVFSEVEDTDFSADIQYRIGNLTLGSTTAYLQEDQVNQQDLFAVDTFFFNQLAGIPDGTPSPPAFYNTQTLTYDIKQFSEEIKLASPTDQPLSYLLGLFYSDTRVDFTQVRNLIPALDNYTVKPGTKTTDVYGRVTWEFRPRTALIVGLRYNYDQLSYRHFQADYTAIPPGPNGEPPVIFHNLSASGSDSESTVVGDLSLQRKFGTGSMAYITYARGYAPAAYNTVNKLTQATSPAQTGALGATIDNLSDPLAEKEDIDHFELGTKGRYFDNRLSVNAALFYTVYKNFQVQIFDQTNTSLSPPLILANAGKAQTQGLEIDTALAVTDRLRLDLNAAYIDAEFKDYAGAPCYYPSVPGQIPPGCSQAVVGGPVTQDLSGKPMPNSPKLKFVLGAEQRIPLGTSDYEAVLAGNYAWRDEAQMLADQNPYAVQPSFGILNLSVGVRKPGGQFAVTVFANNVFDEHYFTDIEDFWSAPWGGANMIVGQVARDTNRYFGLRVSAGF
jgi:iron complex outermembrane receptor protein